MKCKVGASSSLRLFCLREHLRETNVTSAKLELNKCKLKRTGTNTVL